MTPNLPLPKGCLFHYKCGLLGLNWISINGTKRNVNPSNFLEEPTRVDELTFICQKHGKLLAADFDENTLPKNSRFIVSSENVTRVKLEQGSKQPDSCSLEEAKVGILGVDIRNDSLQLSLNGQICAKQVWSLRKNFFWSTRDIRIGGDGFAGK